MPRFVFLRIYNCDDSCTGSKNLWRTNISLNENGRPVNEAQLIAKARNNLVDFARLYHRHYDAVLRYCVHRLFERQTAEDVTSTVFLSVVENFDRFRGNEREFRSWLYKIATNEVNNCFRKTIRRKSFLKKAFNNADNQAANCLKSSNKSERIALLKQVMFELRPRYQTIITLRFFENLKLTEIAEVLGSSNGTIRSQLARALAKLRKKITSAQQEV